MNVDARLQPLVDVLVELVVRDLEMKAPAVGPARSDYKEDKHSDSNVTLHEVPAADADL